MTPVINNGSNIRLPTYYIEGSQMVREGLEREGLKELFFVLA
jgi:hypothetical protein